MFPETKSRETLRFEGNKIHYSPRDQALSDLLYSKNGPNRWKTNSSTAVNISRVTVNCFPVDVIIFAMLPLMAFGRNSFIVRCHVTMNWPMNGRVVAEKRQLYNNYMYCYLFHSWIVHNA